MSRRWAAIGVLMALVSASMLPVQGRGDFLDDWLEQKEKEKSDEIPSLLKKLSRHPKLPTPSDVSREATPDGENGSESLRPQSSTGPTIIGDVIVKGNPRRNTDRIKARLRTQVGKEYNPSTVDDDIRDLYATQQYSDIRTAAQYDGRGRVKVCFHLVDWPNVVEKVTFKGAKHLKEDELRELTGIRPGIPLNPNRNRLACQRILEKYQELDRPSARCTLVKGGDRGDREVVFDIAEGPELEAIHIRFTGNTAVSGARLVRKVYAHITDHYDPAQSEAVIGDLYVIYRDAGYLDVRVTLESKRSSAGNELTFIYHIQEGSRYRIASRAEIVGPKSLPYDCLQQLVKVKKGDYLNGKIVEEDRVRIKEFCQARHQFVSVQATPVFVPDQPGLLKVLYEVQEVDSRIGNGGASR